MEAIAKGYLDAVAIVGMQHALGSCKSNAYRITDDHILKEPKLGEAIRNLYPPNTSDAYRYLWTDLLRKLDLDEESRDDNLPTKRQIAVLIYRIMTNMATEHERSVGESVGLSMTE